VHLPIFAKDTASVSQDFIGTFFGQLYDHWSITYKFCYFILESNVYKTVFLDLKDFKWVLKPVNKVILQYCDLFNNLVLS
jgi:hypothetical protein